MTNLTEHDAAKRSEFASRIKFDESATGQFAAIPDEYSVVSLEEFQAAPNRVRARHTFVDVASLAEYLNKFSTPDTMIAADYAAASVLCTIDGDGPDAPSHKSHTACFVAQTHDKTKAWLKICDKGMSQVEFGLFLEGRAVDVAVPDAADVMDMVMKFDATKKVAFKSSQRLHDGARQFQYVEENDVRGALKLPDHFIVLAPIYRGMEPQRVKYMVRYRIEGGSLRFQVEMHDKDEVMREAFNRCVDGLKTALTADLPVYVTG